jgi:hypothetical protein
VSYGLCVWDPARHKPLPTNSNEALETMERLSNVGDSVNPLLGDFSRALVEHFEASSPGSSVNLKAFWGDDPRQSAITCSTAVYRLDLPSDAGMERLAYVVRAAGHCGLVVYDDENGMCFLPDGTIYPEEMREVWQSDLEELMAGPVNPSLQKPDDRTWLQTIAYELFEATGRGNKRINA